MRILYVLHDTAIGNGATVAFIRLLEGLIAKGIVPFVVLPNTNGVYNVLKDRKVNLFHVKYTNFAYPHFNTVKDKFFFLPRLFYRIILQKRAIQKVIAYAKNKNIDIVHSNVSVLNVGYKCALKINVPHIFHVREFADKESDLHFIPNRRSFIKKLRNKNCYSIFITKALLSYYNMQNNDRAIISYDGIDKPSSPLAINKKQDYLLFVGRVQEAKGLDILLSAYHEYTKLSRNPLRLLIAGGIFDNLYYKKILRFINEKGISNLVTFLGQRKDIDSLMSHAKALLITSKSEGFGLTLIEAAKNGCLIIGRYRRGIKEQIDNGKALEGDDIALSFTTIQELSKLMYDVELSPYDKFIPFIKRAYYYVCSDFYSQQKNIDNVFNFYKRILGKH